MKQSDIHLKWSILCRQSITDVDTNNISLIELLEKINVNVDANKTQENVNVPINYEIISFWVRDNKLENEKFDVKVILIDPKKKKLMEMENAMEFASPYSHLRARINLLGLPISVNGTYIFEILAKFDDRNEYELAGEIELEVEIQKPS